MSCPNIRAASIPSRIAIVAICLSVTPTVPAFASPVSPSPAMNVPLKHHTVTFPDCRLHFDYPADLKPSPDFVMQKMATEVDYRTIRWVANNVSDAFIEMHYDLQGRFWEGTLATLTVRMWLGSTPERFADDIFAPSGLRRAFAEIRNSLGDKGEEYSHSEVHLHGRSWDFDSSTGIYSSALNSKNFIRVLVGVTGNTKRVNAWRDWAKKNTDAILSSLVIEAVK